MQCSETLEQKENTVNNAEKENSGVASQDVAPVAPGAGNSGSEQVKLIPIAGSSAVVVDTLLAGIGVTPDALTALSAFIAELETVVRPFAAISAAERKRFRLQARGSVKRSNIVKDLSAQFAGSVPAATADTLSALQDASEEVRGESARIRGVLLRLEDVGTVVDREFQRRVRSARTALKSDSTFAGADLREQLKLTVKRRPKKVVPATPGATGPNGSTPVAGPVAGGIPATAPVGNGSGNTAPSPTAPGNPAGHPPMGAGAGQ